jgi:hypothetical protein
MENLKLKAKFEFLIYVQRLAPLLSVNYLNKQLPPPATRAT